ncbi:MAG: biopolymer transporter ExbD [Verrucomicrobiota bacterium]
MSLAAGIAPGPRRRARIEIIPLIDVIFFLLATFVLFTLSLNQTKGLKVALPDAATAEARNPADAVTLTIASDGTLAWDKEVITPDQFLIRLQAYRDITREPRVLINGDRDALYNQVRYVIDEVRKAGIAKVFVETRPTTAN